MLPVERPIDGAGFALAEDRRLIKSDLASEYDNEIRLWLEELAEMDEP